MPTDNSPEKAAAVSPFAPYYAFFADFYEAQITNAKHVLDYHLAMVKSFGRVNEDFHSYVVGSAIEAPDAVARAWAMRYTAGGLSPSA
ncbi:hypothetical protein CCR97_29835 [Rhodoplanes elegans]|uniref:Uncharacterized protein n=1 Tax=Rhodoplanes elegans TaxID=29408 RepID=A0A327KZN6_9BRAD|nr:hypothetical protein [Rhodoplanes elegans]MBK5962360.1 hypothetical protein [Rhodoplanes elegans]RAI40848.1 hypothetical protein CH338_05020 [Rhodoplanes elegans]